MHDTEEAHVLLEGTAQYRIGDKTFTVQAPYVARVPAGVQHTFINAGNKPFNLIAVFASKHPNTKRIGPNPLDPHGQKREEPAIWPHPLVDRPTRLAALPPHECGKASPPSGRQPYSFEAPPQSEA